MKWQCALLKPWLPEYPDGDLPAWGKRWLESHLPGCSACRQELAEFGRVIAALEAAPAPDPAPEMWGEFSGICTCCWSRRPRSRLHPEQPAPGGSVALSPGAPALAALLL